MSRPPPLSPILRAYYKWKSIRFPWRRQFLVGMDLQNNTFWEFRDRGTPTPNPANPNPHFRWRRIVYPPPSAKTHPSEIKISPAWHQWLRHTRSQPPSLDEQQADVIRQERMKALAAQADARWAAKPGYVDAPPPSTSSTTSAVGEATRQPPLLGKGMVVEAKEKEEEVRDEGAVLKDQRQKSWKEMKEQEDKIPARDDPWRQANRGGPSEEWQPKAWAPPGGKK